MWSPTLKPSYRIRPADPRPWSVLNETYSRLLPDTMHVVAAADGAVTYFQTESRHRKNKQDVGGQIDSGKAVNHPKREHHHSKFRAYNTLLSLLAS